MRDLRPDELSHVYGGTSEPGKTNPGKGTEKHTEPRATKGADKKASSG